MGKKKLVLDTSKHFAIKREVEEAEKRKKQLNERYKALQVEAQNDVNRFWGKVTQILIDEEYLPKDTDTKTVDLSYDEDSECIFLNEDGVDSPLGRILKELIDRSEQ